jgi:leucyl/phenylalanyl-tRNA--protein transferase
MTVYLLSEKLVFPPPNWAREDGLLAVGGDLSVPRLLRAYAMGIFPWYSHGEPICWWSPDPRLVLKPDRIHLPHSLKKTMRRGRFEVTLDTAFRDVITACARIRRRAQQGTWIVPEMIEAYCRLHDAGYAHSAESWRDGRLAGGLYGVSLGGMFFGESMFTRVSDASKVAFATLMAGLRSRRFHLVDCQISTDHLKRFGACEIPRSDFLQRLERAMQIQTLRGRWKLFPGAGDDDRSDSTAMVDIIPG